MSLFHCESLAKQHDRQAFRCGVQELDDYLAERAGQDMRRHVAAVFVLVPKGEPHRVAGYYTLSAASVVLTDLPEDFAGRLPRYPVVPAVLLGRLARDIAFPGVGKLLLMDALNRAYQHSRSVAVAMLVVDAQNEHAKDFYLRHGFRDLPALQDRLFLPMKTIETLISVV